MSSPSQSSNELVKQLSKIEWLQQVPSEQLEWLTTEGEVRDFKAGEHVFEKGAPIDRLIIILKGTVQFKLEQQGEYRVLNELTEGDISGALPFSRATTAMAAGITKEKSRILLLSKEHFHEMVRNYPELTEALVHVMTSRVRDFTLTQQQTEKMAALGRMSAGLHHELNNPAAAASRAANELKAQLRLVPAKFKELMLLQLSPQQVEEILELLFRKLDPKQQQHSQSLMERTSLEDELVEWLENQEADEAFAIAETFAQYSFSLDELERLSETAGQKQAGPILDWLYSILTTNKLIADIQESTRRISSLVSAVKNYSHMDRSPERERTDLEASLRTTLVMLNHKLKKKNIQVKMDASPDLPHPCVYAGELNQVWTNLIDNAIDAMEKGGELQISLSAEGEEMVINITDNGSGISEEVIHKIFEPFFTTKSVGEGSGIGLDISKKIIEHHGGSIGVNSASGQTTFTIRLPENPVT